jgi:hypothetical protein
MAVPEGAGGAGGVWWRQGERMPGGFTVAVALDVEIHDPRLLVLEMVMKRRLTDASLLGSNTAALRLVRTRSLGHRLAPEPPVG